MDKVITMKAAGIVAGVSDQPDIPWLLQVMSDYRFVIMPVLCAAAVAALYYTLRDLFGKKKRTGVTLRSIALPAVIVLCVMFGLAYRQHETDSMPDRFERPGYCLEKAVWLAERFESAPAYVLIGWSDVGTLHAEAVWMVGGDYVAIDGNNGIVEVKGRYSIKKAKEMLEEREKGKE